jgi:glycosyltransferase involved in cell wall biosynthesis
MLGRRLTDLAWMAARPLVALRRWLLWPHSVRGWWAALAAELVPADLYHACGVLAVSPALALRRRHQRRSAGRPARVIYDVIDDALSGDAVRGMPGLLRAWHGRREAGWARAVDGLVTVNEALGRRLEARWRPARPIVILPNIPERPDPALVERPPDRIRETLGLGKEIRIVLVHGRIGPHLAIEELEAAVLSMPQTALVLMGFGIGYEAAAARDHDERYRGRHFTLSARPPAELLTWTASADVVVVPLRPTSVNHQLATPNKFWEAVVVGTPVVVPAGLTLLADLVRTHDLGAVARSEQPADLAAALRAILDRPEIERRAWRRRIAAAAAGQFDPAGGADRYRALVRSLWSPDDRGAG